MSLSVIICEGPRDRIVLARALTQLHGWVPVSNQAAKPKWRKGELGTGNVATLTHPAGRSLAVAERSRERILPALSKLARHKIEDVDLDWSRLLVVTDADGQDIEDVAQVSLHRARGYMAALTIKQTDDPWVASSAPLALRQWVDISLMVPETTPAESRTGQVRVIVLPGPGQAGNMDNFLVGQLNGEEPELVSAAGSYVSAAKAIPQKQHLTGVSDPIKAQLGATFAVLDPLYTYTGLEQRLAKYPWEKLAGYTETFAALADL